MILIIGAGPIGCYLAKLLAQKGKQVEIWEEHKVIGKPFACSGLLSKNLFKFFSPPKQVILNKIYGAEVYSPSGICLKLQTKEPQAQVIDRIKFDKWLADEAKKAGAKIYTNKRYRGEKADILIGADGPNSEVAKRNNLFGKRKFWIGQQIRAKLKVNQKLVQIYLSRKFSKDFFAWVVPEGKGICRIGTASSENTPTYFNNFLKFVEKKFNQKIKPIDKQSGLIPQFNPWQRLSKRKAFLVGDAALQVKATSGGGIIAGLTAARRLASAILQNKPYKIKRLWIDLFLHKLIRDRANNLSDKKLDKLISLLNQPKNKTLLEQHGDMDFPSKFIFRLLIKNPQLIFSFC